MRTASTSVTRTEAAPPHLQSVADAASGTSGTAHAAPTTGATGAVSSLLGG